MSRAEIGRATRPPSRDWSSALAFLLLLVARPASAADSRYNVSVVAGLTRASVSGDPIPEYTMESRVRFLAGGRVSMRLREDLQVGIEPSYVRRGGNAVHVVDDRNDTEETTRIDLDYLELPLLFRAFASPGGHPYALGGIGIGFLVNADAQQPDGSSVDLSDGIRSTDTFAFFGGGFETTIGGHATFFEARYTQGLSSVNEGGIFPNLALPLHFKNSALQLVAGWRVWP